MPHASHSHLAVSSFCDSSAISTCSSTYPLRLISPPCRTHQKAALAFMMSYGGGLVAGDEVHLTVTVNPSARLALLTQGSTKVYKTSCKTVRSRQTMTAEVGDGAALLLLPDPLQPFKDSAHEQVQAFHVHPSSSLFVLDWVSAGRTARGEMWEFTECRTKNEVYLQDGQKRGKLLVRDNLVLCDSSSTFQDEMDGLGVFGTLIIRGPLFDSVSECFMKRFSALARIGPNGQRMKVGGSASDTEGETEPEGLVWTAARIRGSVVVKFGACEVDRVRKWLRGFLASEGTLHREFGPKALLCLH
ncbi:UreD urease accessory protein-domain-containing protein [Aspergillus unguis]